MIQKGHRNGQAWSYTCLNKVTPNVRQVHAHGQAGSYTWSDRVTLMDRQGHAQADRQGNAYGEKLGNNHGQPIIRGSPHKSMDVEIWAQVRISCLA